MKANKRTFLSLLLAFCMLFSMVPSMTAGAEEDDTEKVTTEEVEDTTEDMEEKAVAETAKDVAKDVAKVTDVIAEETANTTEEAETDEAVPVEEMAPEQSEIQYVEGVTATPDAEGLPSNDELFAMWMQEQLYGGIAPCADYGKKVLNPASYAWYSELRLHIEKIAQGLEKSTMITWSNPLVCSWTYKELGVERITTVEEVTNLLKKQMVQVVDCLLVDCPFDFYWFDKTIGYGMNGDIPFEVTKEGLTVKISGMYFTVAEAYQDGDAYTVSNKEAEKVTIAAENAKAVVAKYADLSDYEKLLAYQQYICESVMYNEEALAPNTPYGDPWQLISVFDGDPETNVVCEGYSKAFQYLCDLSTFKEGTVCYTVTGNLGSVNEPEIRALEKDTNNPDVWKKAEEKITVGLHMWNIVTMNGKNYLVDVTNSDHENQALDILFLEGTDIRTQTNDKYVFPYSAADGSVIGFYYAYDADTLNLYSEKELVLAGTCYCLHERKYIFEGENTVPATCVKEGTYDRIVYCQRCGEVFEEEHKILPALGHDVKVWETTKEPTCTEKGSEKGVCTVCNETVTREIEALGHDYEVTEEAVDPTCTEDGKTAVETCSRCGEKKGGETVAAIGHKWDDGKVSKEPTTTEEGEKTYTCEVCGEIKTEKIPVEQQKDNGAPKTGDNNVAMMWMMLLVVSGACAAGVASQKKRRNR